jgi:hypothetical protein
MGVYIDQVVTGDVVVPCVGGNEVLLVCCRLTGIPPNVVSHPDATAPDHLLRAGWLSLGDTFSLPGDTPREYWRYPIYLDFETLFWTPVPTDSAAGPFRCIASLVRVHMAPGVAGQLYVFGV